MREAYSAGAGGARGRGGGPWAEASPGVPAAAPRGHVPRAPRRGGRGRGCQRSAGGPPRRGPSFLAGLPGWWRPGSSASPARSTLGWDLADRAGLLPPPPLRAMDGGNSARRRSRRRQSPPALPRGRPPLASLSVCEALVPPDSQPGRCLHSHESWPAGWRPREAPRVPCTRPEPRFPFLPSPLSRARTLPLHNPSQAVKPTAIAFHKNPPSLVLFQPALRCFWDFH